MRCSLKAKTRGPGWAAQELPSPLFPAAEPAVLLQSLGLSLPALVIHQGRNGYCSNPVVTFPSLVLPRSENSPLSIVYDKLCTDPSANTVLKPVGCDDPMMPFHRGSAPIRLMQLTVGSASVGMSVRATVSTSQPIE